MWVWVVKTAFPWMRANPKYVLYAAGILAILLFIGYEVYSYGSHVWAESQRQEYLRGRKEADNLFEAREKVLLKEIETEKKKNAEGVAKNEADRKLLAAREDELLRARHALDLAAARIEAKVIANIAAGYQAGRNLTADNAAAAIIKLSRELEADHDWRSRIPNSGSPRTNGVSPPK